MKNELFIIITWLRLVADKMRALIGKEWYQSRALYNSNDNKLIMD